MDNSEEHHLFEQLMSLCKAMFENKHYETAYHLLTGGEHYARDIQNESYLAALKQLAEEQHDWINAHAPQSVMSSRSAAERNGVDLYHMLIRQINAQMMMVRENQRRKQTPPRRWLDDREA